MTFVMDSKYLDVQRAAEDAARIAHETVDKAEALQKQCTLFLRGQ